MTMHTTAPLSGIRVVDLSRLLPAPLATTYLADLGADVIKVENTASPDPIRYYPPFVSDQSVYYWALNRNKRSLALPLRTAAGIAALHRLVATADIVVDSFRAGVLQQMGIDYATISQQQARIIYVSVTGYGQTGSYSTLAGHDLNYAGIAALLDVLRPPNSPPQLPTLQFADVVGGSYQALNACLLALFARERTGKGSYTDVAMIDGTLPLLTIPFAIAQATQHPHEAQQYLQMLAGALPNYHIYRCSDERYVVLAALEPKFWQNFCQAIEQPQWVERLLVDNTALHHDLCSLFASQAQAYWLQLNAAADCCISPLNTLGDLANDPYLQQRQAIVTHHYQQQPLSSFAYPLHNSSYHTTTTAAAPTLGQHNQALLTELGYTAAQIQALQTT